MAELGFICCAGFVCKRGWKLWPSSSEPQHTTPLMSYRLLHCGIHVSGQCHGSPQKKKKKTVVQKKTGGEKTAEKKEGISEGEPRPDFCTVSCSTLWRRGIAVCLRVCGREGGGGAVPSSFVKVRGHYRLTSTCPPNDCIWSWKKGKEKQKEKDCAKQLYWLLPVTSSKHWKKPTFLTIEARENKRV